MIGSSEHVALKTCLNKLTPTAGFLANSDRVRVSGQSPRETQQLLDPSPPQPREDLEDVDVGLDGGRDIGLDGGRDIGLDGGRDIGLGGGCDVDIDCGRRRLLPL